jgi:Ni,Fe-hydrogenase III small subunit
VQFGNAAFSSKREAFHIAMQLDIAHSAGVPVDASSPGCRQRPRPALRADAGEMKTRLRRNLKENHDDMRADAFK